MCINSFPCLLHLLMSYSVLCFFCLIRAESPSQVFFILLQWLLTLVQQSGGYKNLGKVAVAYDNMCHVDGLIVARKPLPFPAPLDKMWMNIDKFIDTFHLRNHVNPRCHEVYNPERLAVQIPNMNTQAAEQTFTWIARFRHIVCAMNKQHHLFYIHRMVLRRNMYTSKCYAMGKRPILPKATH